MNHITNTRQVRRTFSQPLGEPFRLVRSGQYLNIRPAILGLDHNCSTVWQNAVPGEQQGVRVVGMSYPSIWTQHRHSRSYSQCFAGLEPTVHEAPKAEGYSVVLPDERPANLAAPRLALLGESDTIDSLVLNQVRHHDRGLIRYAPQQVESARLIEQVALAWPKAKIIVAARVSSAVELRRRLHGVLGKVALFTTITTRLMERGSWWLGQTGSVTAQHPPPP